MQKNLLLTGRPGIGKTTAIIKTVKLLSLSGIRPHGFFTEEIRESGKRTGFQIQTLEGRTGTLSHLDQESS
ncbi:MAG: hypothetical protein NT009_14105 [Proteobacteria bacterium]|nr:hypothetical protein [Pseudomonadota bacterium]